MNKQRDVSGEGTVNKKKSLQRFRDNAYPLARHQSFDDEYVKARPPVNAKAVSRIDIYSRLPRPSPGVKEPLWNSVALFFNLNENDQPDDYQETTVQDAYNLLDEGEAPADPTLSVWMTNYWRTLSYGNLVFGIDMPKEDGVPLIPCVDALNGDSQDWGVIKMF